MGQQQLLLLVLGVVIVGLAVVVGIDAFRIEGRKAEFDRLTATALRVGGNAYAWKQTPRAMGGGVNTTYFSTLTLDQLGFEGAQTEGDQSRAVVGGIEYKLIRRDVYRTHLAVTNVAEDIGVAVFFLGPEPACLALRRHWKEGNRQVYHPAMTPPVPAGCTSWR